MSAESPNTPILDLLTSMTEDSLKATSLDDETLMLVRIAALVAVDAPPASYMLNLKLAGGAGVDEQSVEGVLAAVAPIVGTSRIASAVTNMAKALELKIELGHLLEE